MTTPRRTLHLDPDAPFGIRTVPEGHWTILCRERRLPALMGYRLDGEDEFRLLSTGLPGTVAPPAVPVVRTAVPAPDLAEILGLPPTEPVTHVDPTGNGAGTRVIVPDHLWVLAPF